MFYQGHTTRILALTLSASALFGGLLYNGASAQQQQQQDNSAQQEKSRPRRTGETPQTGPTPKPSSKDEKEDEVTLQDDEVVRVETDLTNILFTAVDKQKRFITSLKQEDVRVTEDGQPQEIFTFARQTDLPLSLAILIDTSISEERRCRLKRPPPVLSWTRSCAPTRTKWLSFLSRASPRLSRD